MNIMHSIVLCDQHYEHTFQGICKFFCVTIDKKAKLIASPDWTEQHAYQNAYGGS